MIELDAYIYGKKIGTLMDHKGTIYFQYDKEFLVSGIEISPLKLPLSDAIYTNYEHKHLYNGLAGVFFDSLPDKHGMALSIDTLRG